jgi:integrase
MPRPNAGPRLKLRRQKKTQPIWEIVWYEKGRRRTRSTGTGCREEAQSELAKFILQREAASKSSDPEQRMISEVLLLYASEHAPHVSDPERISYAIDALTAFWNDKTLADIDENTCAEFCRTRNSSDWTLRRELGTLQAAINYDLDKRRLTRHVSVFLPEKPSPRDRHLTRGEAASLLRAARKFPKARKHLVLFILLGMYTGARKEAMLSLKWSQVELESGWINFQGDGIRRTKKRRARPPIVNRLKPFLRAAKRRSANSGYVIEYEGEPIDDLKKSFKAACVLAGLDDVTPHTLRHTAITWLMQAGVPVWTVSGFVGASPETIHRVYGHHSPDYLQQAKDALEQGGRTRRKRQKKRQLA